MILQFSGADAPNFKPKELKNLVTYLSVGNSSASGMICSTSSTYKAKYNPWRHQEIHLEMYRVRGTYRVNYIAVHKFVLWTFFVRHLLEPFFPKFYLNLGCRGFKKKKWNRTYQSRYRY